MTPIPFEGTNVIIAEDQPPYFPLPGQFISGPNGELLTCWELSEEELAEIVNTRRLWVTVLTFGQMIQPLAISTDKPVL